MVTDKIKFTSFKVLAASSIGGGLEIYDFIIYIIFSNIIASLYFPQGNHYVSLLATFGIFAIGYFMRPIGGILFGFLGDRTGRKKWLLCSILLMGLATIAIGCLPTYQSIGIWAPILLTLFRLLQGIAVGGDLPGGITYVAEHANQRSRGVNCAIVFCGVNFGLLLASGMGTVITAFLNHDQLYSWGWRVAFWFSAVLILLGLYLRLGLTESMIFLQAIKHKRIVKNPLRLVLHKALHSTIVGIGLTWLFSILIMQVFTKLPSYLHENSALLTVDKAMLLNTFSVAVFALLIPFMGFLSDYIGRKKMLVIATMLWIILAYPLYKALLVPNLVIVIFAIVVLDILGAAIVGTVPAALTELFASNTRYTGVAFTYNISFAFFGGLTPLFLTWLSHAVHDQALQALNIIIAAVIALLATLAFKDKSKQTLDSIDN
jgi:MFS family permease